MSEGRLAVMEVWREDHILEHQTLWGKHDTLEKRVTQGEIEQAKTDTKLAIYTSLGVGVGSILGSVIGALIIYFLVGVKP